MKKLMVLGLFLSLLVVVNFSLVKSVMAACECDELTGDCVGSGFSTTLGVMPCTSFDCSGCVSPAPPVKPPVVAPPTSGGSNGGDPANGTPPPSVELKDPLGKEGDLVKVVNQMIKGALGVTGVLALIAFIWGGIEWLISQGNKEKITKGKDMMIWAVLGLVVIFGSYAILSLVFQVLGAA